jgi:ATP10 protein
MKRFSKCVAMTIGLLTPALPLHPAQSLPAPLQVGSVFPAFSGRTVTDHPVTLPGSSMEQATVLEFSFSRTAGKDARLWNEHLANDFPDNVSVYGVIQLESAPKIFRRLAISGIKSSMPVSVQNRTIVLYHNEQLWRQRLAVNDESRAYVVLLDRSGAIRWMNSGAFSVSTYGMLKAKLATLLRSYP